jgi:hypothetical protein
MTTIVDEMLNTDFNPNECKLFLYKLRNGKYMRQLDKNEELEKLLFEKPQIENGKVTIELYYKKYHNEIVIKCIEINENHESYTCYYVDEWGINRYPYEPSTPW